MEVDLGSGVDPSSIKIMMNGSKIINHLFDKIISRVTSKMEENLSKSAYSVVLEVADKLGNPAVPSDAAIFIKR